MTDNLIFVLVIWSVLGVCLMGCAGDTFADLGPLALGFVCFVCGPIVFAFYLLWAIVSLLSILDERWFK